MPVLKPHKNENPTIRWVSDFCPLNEKTKPLIDKWNAVKIDAEKPANEVFDQLMEALEKDHALKLCETVQIS